MASKSMTEISLVKDLLDVVGGMEAIELVKICEKKRRSFTDEEVAKKMKKKVTEIRAILNKLHFRGIATYQKSRNQKTGWYNYTWDIKKERIAEIVMEQQSENLQKLMDKKSLETDYNFFDCGGCGERTPFEAAAEFNFLCPKCGGKMDSANEPKKQKELDEKIKKIQKELEMVSKLGE
jgi:transcription initiation factor TFIIE subunit alpha